MGARADLKLRKEELSNGICQVCGNKMQWIGTTGMGSKNSKRLYMCAQGEDSCKTTYLVDIEKGEQTNNKIYPDNSQC